MPKKGFAPIIIVLIIALLAAGGITGYTLIKNKQPNKETTTTTKEAITIPTITTTKLTTATTTKPKTTTTLQATPAIFDVKITSVTCKWVVIKDEYGNPSDCLRDIVTGTASGPVGARLELPLLVWSTDKFDCGEWTHYTGALVTVGSTCRRKAGQPETTTWTVDTEGDECPLKNYFNNNRTYNVKIYDNDDLYEKKNDARNYLCQ